MKKEIKKKLALVKSTITQLTGHEMKIRGGWARTDPHICTRPNGTSCPCATRVIDCPDEQTEYTFCECTLYCTGTC